MPRTTDTPSGFLPIRSSLRWGLLAWMLFALGAFTVEVPAVAEPARKVQESKAELLQGELLEVSAGDLQGAMRIYRSLVDAESTPEPVRARALLYLARCHRKLGELELARQRLRELLEKHSREEAILGEAESYLRELRSGTAETPAFDWMREIESNPEIQARVFDLAMEVISESSPEGYQAGQQLRALGGIAVPVLEKVIQNTRNPRHREHLALILVEAGKQEYLREVFRGDLGSNRFLRYALGRYARSLPGLDDETRSALLRHVGELPEQTAPQNRAHQAYLRLQAGDTSRFVEDAHAMIVLRDQVASNGWSYPIRYSRESLIRAGLRDPENARSFVRYLQEDRSLHQQFFAYLLMALQETPDLVPEALMGRLVAKVEKDPDVDLGWHWLEEVVERTIELEREETLVTLNAIERAMESKRVNVAQAVRDSSLSGAQKAGFYRRIGAWSRLHSLAENDDDAVLAFREFLLRRGELAPDYLGFSRPDRSGRRGARVNRRTTRGPIVRGQAPPEAEPPPWTPSPAYAEAMGTFLDDPDPVTRAIALEALAHAAPGVGPEISERVIPILENANEDPFLQKMGLSALLQRLEGRPETGHALAKTFVSIFERDSTRLLDEAYFQSPFAGRDATLGSVRLATYDPNQGHTYGMLWAWRVYEHTPKTRQLFFEYLEPILEEGRGLELLLVGFECFRKGRRNQETWYENAILERIDQYQGVEAQTLLLELLDKKRYQPPGVQREQSFALDPRRALEKPALYRFLAATLPNPAIPAGIRWEAFGNLAKYAEHRRQVIETFDATKILRSPDPFAGYLSRLSFGELAVRNTEEELVRTALESPRVDVRTQAIRSFDRRWEGFLPLLAEEIRSENPEYRSVAARRILELKNIEAFPLLLEVLRRADTESRLAAIEQLAELAVAESQEPLARLLDDPELEVRNAALQALEKIQGTLYKKAQWKKISEESDEGSGKEEEDVKPSGSQRTYLPQQRH